MQKKLTLISKYLVKETVTKKHVTVVIYPLNSLQCGIALLQIKDFFQISAKKSVRKYLIFGDKTWNKSFYFVE